jgi:hypothetical protein
MERALHCYAYVEAPWDQVSRLLAEDSRSVLQHATIDAADQAEEMTRTLKLEVGGFTVSKEVTIEVGTFVPRDLTRSVVPLRWHAERGRLLFPELAADLEVASVSLDPPLTQLTVVGSYEPPLGLLGAGADRFMLHRLAEATIHRFIHEVADELRRLIAALPDDETF